MNISLMLLGTVLATKQPVIPAPAALDTPNTKDNTIITAAPLPPGPGMAGGPITPAQKAARRFSQEPTAQDLMREASNIAQLSPKHVEALNRASRLRSLLPTASVQYGYGWHETTGLLQDPILNMNSESNEAYGGWGIIVGGSWDLPSLVFNPAELQTYYVHGMRNNIIKEVSKTYYARRQAILQYYAMDNSDEMAKMALQQRIQEYESILDGLTENYFSKEMQRRGLEPI